MTHEPPASVEREKLLPCPFCGSKAFFIADDSHNGCGVGCSKPCEAEPYCGAVKHLPEKAIAEWNTRASTPPARPGREDVERVARALYEEDDPWHKAWPWPNLNPEAQGGEGAAEAYRRLARAALGALFDGASA